MPHLAADPIPVACEIVMALQSFVTRRVDAFDPVVITVTRIQSGSTGNVIPPTAHLLGTIRSVSERAREEARDGVRRVAEGIAAAHGIDAKVHIVPGYPVTVNAPGPTEFAASVARSISGASSVEADGTMGGEDFAYMLQARPGAYIFLGNGESTELHSDTYDFNDEIIPVGVSYWVKLVETAMPVAS